MSTAAWGGVYASGSDGSASGQSFDTSYGGGAGGGGHYQQGSVESSTKLYYLLQHHLLLLPPLTLLLFPLPTAFQEKVLVPRPWKDYHPAPG